MGKDKCAASMSARNIPGMGEEGRRDLAGWMYKVATAIEGGTKAFGREAVLRGRGSAIIKLIGASLWHTKGRKAIAKWLRHQAECIVDEGARAYTQGRFTCRYMHA